MTTPLDATSTAAPETGATAAPEATEPNSSKTKTTSEDVDDEGSTTVEARRRRRGGGGGSDDDGAERRSARRRPKQADARAQFIARGDAICADYRKRESAARAENDGRKESQVKYLSTVASLVSESIDRLKALGAAPGDRAKFDAYVAKLEELAGHVRRFRDAIANDDRSYAEAARRVADTSAEARALARDYGFRVCGSE